MIDLFGTAGLEALVRLSRRPTLYAFDFDGTLAPIVDRPEDARAAPTTMQRLSRLGALVPTALVSGRSVDDLRRRIAFTPLHLIGNHGAEGIPDRLHDSPADAVSAHGGADAHRDVVLGWLSQWSAAREQEAADDGIVVEPKSHSLSIHYRKSSDHAAARHTIERVIERLSPRPRVIGGKCVFNLLPEGAPDKGTALRTLVHLEHCEAAFFIGDDLTDELAFVDAPASWVTVRVGRDEHSAARYCVDDQADIDRCLDRLIVNAEAAADARP